HRLLVVSMALLLAEVVGSDTLHKVQYIEQRIAEELRENQRTDDDAKFACVQTFYLWWVRDGALLQAMSSGIKNRLRALWYKRWPWLALKAAVQAGTDVPANITPQ